MNSSIPINLPSTLNSLFFATCRVHFGTDEVDLYELSVDESSFKAALQQQANPIKDFDAQDVRGFGDALPDLPIGALLDLLKLVGAIVAGELAKDATMEITYRALLVALMKLPTRTRERFEPWTSRVSTYLQSKLSDQ